jgi:tripeptidyl-peptidase I
MLPSILLVAALVAQASAVPSHARSTYEVKERHFVPRRWQRVRRAPADHVIDLQIGVKHGNFAGLEKRLNEGRQCAHLCSMAKMS